MIFFEKLTERSVFVAEKNLRIPTDYTSLLRKAEGNPVATSMEFHAMLCALFEALLGIPMSAKSEIVFRMTMDSSCLNSFGGMPSCWSANISTTVRFFFCPAVKVSETS